MVIALDIEDGYAWGSVSEYNVWTCGRRVCSNQILLSSWEFVQSLIGVQLFEDMPPYSLCLGKWSYLGQKIEHKNSSHPLTISTDGSAPSPCPVSATGTMRLASRKAVKHPFPFLCICLAVSHSVTP